MSPDDSNAPALVPVSADGTGGGGWTRPPRARGLAAGLAVLTYCVVVAGSIVTSTRSGLADRSWPLFEGSVLPSPSRMSENRGLLFEHGHRMIAGTAVLLTWILAIWLLRKGAPRAIVRLAFACAAVGLVPAVLGGLTVLFAKENLPGAVSIAHVSAAMAFLSLNTALATTLGNRWARARSEVESGGGIAEADLKGFGLGSVFCAAALYLQAVLGAVPRHFHGGEMAHILWAFVVFTAVVLLASSAMSRFSRLPALLRPAMALLLLLLVQFFLGFTAYVTRPGEAKAPGSSLYEMIASAHLAVGALMLATSVVLAVRAVRIRRVTAGAGSPAGLTAAERGPVDVDDPALAALPEGVS
jgi:heme a synthase